MLNQHHPIKQINGRFVTAPDSFILRSRGAWKDISANHLFVPKGEEFSVCVDALAIAIHFGSPVSLDWQWGDDQQHLKTPVHLGSCHIQPGGVPHWSRWVRDDAGNMLVILLEQSFLQQVAQDVVDLDRTELVGQFGVRDRTLENFGNLFQTEVDSGARANQLYVESLATALVLHLYRSYSNEAKPIQLPSGGLSQSLLRQVSEYIDVHMNEDISLIDLATLSGMSASHFGRLFKKSVGKTPSQYMTHCRIERAKQLLSHPITQISDISHQLGFYDQSQFTTTFRKWVGVTPKKYRASL